MIRFIDWLNSKTGVVNKTYFKYECTYVWSSLISNFIALCLFFICSVFLLFMMDVMIGMNLEHLKPEWSPIYYKVNLFFVPDPEVKTPIKLVLCLDISFAVICFCFFMSVYSVRLTTWAEKMLERFCKKL